MSAREKATVEALEAWQGYNGDLCSCGGEEAWGLSDDELLDIARKALAAADAVGEAPKGFVRLSDVVEALRDRPANPNATILDQRIERAARLSCAEWLERQFAEAQPKPSKQVGEGVGDE